MSIETLAIPLGCVVLAVIVCWSIIAVIRWWIKLGVILLVPLFGLLVWDAIPSYQGWPTPEAPPERALLYWATVRPPDPKSEDPGALFVWLVPMDAGRDDGSNPLRFIPFNTEPRIYRLPYAEPARQKLEKVVKEITKSGGQPAVFRQKPKPGRGKGSGKDGDGKSQDSGDEAGGGEEGEEGGEGDPYDYDLPDTEIRTKD